MISFLLLTFYLIIFENIINTVRLTNKIIFAYPYTGF
jgi:hypothetical protein